jgi:hypothetical protein
MSPVAGTPTAIYVNEIKVGDILVGWEDCGPVTSVETTARSTLICWRGEGNGLPLRGSAMEKVYR